MGAHEARVRRLADRVKVIVAETLETRVKDPRLGFVTITDARVTNDMREATVFYTVLGSPEELAETAAALESAKGILRTEVGRQTGVRHTPSLTFIADARPGERPAHRRPARPGGGHGRGGRRRPRWGREYAGEADPYKAPREDEDADRRRRRGPAPRPARRDRRLSCPRPASRLGHGRTSAPCPRESSSSTSPRAGPPTTWSRGCAGSPAPAGSATPARWTRWRPASWSSGSAGPPGCSGHISGSDKTYAATIRLGWATVTDDAEGERLGGAPADDADRWPTWPR